MGKSKNISIRFDEEKTAFAFAETKIEKHQKLVDYLLEQFWWQHKMYNNPILDRYEKIAEVVKNTELGKKAMEEIKNKPTVFKITDIKPNGEVQGVYELKQKEHEPKEGSMAFFNKYGVSTYAEIPKKQD